MTEHVVATFSTQQAAGSAAQELENAGFPASAIRQYQGGNRGGSGRTSFETATETTDSSGGGFWAWLLGEEGPQTRTAHPCDEEWYDRRAGAGDTVLSVAVTDDSRIHQATTILESHQPIEMEETTEENNVVDIPAAGSGDRMVRSPAPVTGTSSLELGGSAFANRDGRSGRSHPACRRKSGDWQTHRRPWHDTSTALRRGNAS